MVREPFGQQHQHQSCPPVPWKIHPAPPAPRRPFHPHPREPSPELKRLALFRRACPASPPVSHGLEMLPTAAECHNRRPTVVRPARTTFENRMRRLPVRIGVQFIRGRSSSRMSPIPATYARLAPTACNAAASEAWISVVGIVMTTAPCQPAISASVRHHAPQLSNPDAPRPAIAPTVKPPLRRRALRTFVPAW